MAKRFTDSEKWKDIWFGDLPSKYKLFWFFLLDDCNHAGIWKVNFRVAQFLIGESLEQSEVKRYLLDRIIVLNEEYWFVPKFIKFQYPNGLKSNVKAHNSVIKELERHNLTSTINKQFGNSYLRVLDKDKDKDIVKTDTIKKEKVVIPSKKEFMLYAKSKLSDDDYKRKRDNLILKYDSWVEAGWKDGFNKPIKNWKSKLLNNLQFIQSKNI